MTGALYAVDAVCLLLLVAVFVAAIAAAGETLR